MKKGLIITGLGLIVIVVGYWAVQGKNFGAINEEQNITLMGSSSNYVSVPKGFVEANSTTTDPAMPDGGGTVQQLVNTGGIRKILLNIATVGGTATSTVFIRQYGSFDGTNFFHIATSTEARIASATSTVSFISPYAFTGDPGTASTSLSIPVQIDGYKFTRFLFYGEDLVGDPNDGVQAWVTATLVRDTNK